MRLIDVDALKQIHGMKDDCAECDKELRGKSKSCEYDRTYTLMDFCGWLDDMPTIEPESKTGKWIRITQGAIPEKYMCPFCHRTVEHEGVEYLVSVIYPFCHCGARMVQEGEDNG